MHYYNEPDFSHDKKPCIGILLTNLGSPEAPTPSAVRRYLAEFLSDPRMVEIPRYVWLPILYGFILPFRAKRSAHLYETIFREDGTSPLTYYSQQIANQLKNHLEQNGSSITIALGMRYGKPSIQQALLELKAANARKLLVLPLFPQYASSTTGSIFDAVSQVLQQWRWIPETRFINHYADNPLYIQSIAHNIQAHWKIHGRSEKLLFSFHGIPKRSLLNGDPYHCYCQKTARLIAEHLQLPNDAWQVVFQSRFGRAEWLKPYCLETLVDLAKNHVTSVDVLCPGFSVDCLETLEEITIQNANAYYKAGGKTLHYIPALNDSPEHIDLLEALIQQHTEGWR